MNSKRTRYCEIMIVTALVVGLMLGGCDSFGSSQGAASQQTLPRTAATASTASTSSAPKDVALPKLTGAHTIHIEDSWGGYNTASPVLADYLLLRGADVFSGTGNFSMGDETVARRVTTATEIIIPLHQVQSFLEVLERTPLAEGHYRPTPTCCDNYPNFKMTVSLESGTSVTFQSADDQAPLLATPLVPHRLWAGLGSPISWGVTIGSNNGSKEYLATSDLPDAALLELWSYLRKDEIEDKLYVRLGEQFKH